MTAVLSRRKIVILIGIAPWLLAAGCTSVVRSAAPGSPAADITVSRTVVSSPVSVPTSVPVPASGSVQVRSTPAIATPNTTRPSPTRPTITRPATTTGSAGSPGRARLFVGESAAIEPVLAQRMSSTWRHGCPVPLSALSHLRLSYRGFDGQDHIGQMIVATKVAMQVISVFHLLFDQRYPVRRMALVDDFGGSDDASMTADNTSGFNCRPVTGGTGFSQHSYGQAIDVDPVENPYIGGGQVLPPAGAAYVGRPGSAGVIHHGDTTVAAFATIGWTWGGDWFSPRDYQHFSANGR